MSTTQGCIYLLRNTVNGKCYVGQSVVCERRLKRHLFEAKRGNDLPLYRAIRKYGAEYFSVAILWRGPADMLNVKEVYYIENLSAFADTGQGYNLTTGGGAPKMSAGTKIKTSASMRKFYAENPAARERVSTTSRHSWAAKTEEQRMLEKQTMREVMLLRLANLEQRQKLATAVRKIWDSPSAHQNASEGALRRFESSTEREKIRQSALRRYEDPAERERSGAASRRAWANDPARRQRARESALRQCAKRAAQIDAVMNSTAGLFGDLQATATLPEIAALSMAALGSGE